MRFRRIHLPSLPPVLALLSLALLLVPAEWAAPLPYPLLGSLGPDDSIYRQQQEQLEASYTAIAAGRPGPALVLYLFEARSELDLFSLAARLNLPYETLATLNRMDRARTISPGERILVPSAPGLFVSETQASDLDFVLSYRAGQAGERLSLQSGGGSAYFRFFRGERFNPEERALFLGLLFRFPLPAGKVTSGFGARINPVTGQAAVHHGVDLAAPMGTDVYAARDGTVVASGVDAVLGEYIIVGHEGGWQTVYGHLSLRLVRLNDKVDSGMIIGHVGSTGQSTGPHLHFEVRNHGAAQDPEALIPKVKR
jgi:murein DD-endopeptidase MepM/ murein hydrolase activator NlpD